jgi:hypothetical protein
MEENTCMAPHERDKTTAGSLRASLARDGGAEGDCPDSGILAAYYERSLDSRERPRYELHFSRCRRCREQLAAMIRAEEAPRVVAVPHRARLWDWRWLAPGVAALLIVTVWIARRSVPMGSPAQNAKEPLVAKSQADQETAPEFRRSVQGPPSEPSRAISSKRQATNQFSARLQQVPEVAPPQQMKKQPNRPVKGRDVTGLKALSQPVSIPPVATSQTTDAQTPGVTESPRAAVPATPPTGAAGGAIASAADKTSGKPGAANEETSKQGLALELAGRNAATIQAATQASEQRSSEIVIRTPDPQVLWRITGGRFVERSDDAGATWNGQLPDANARLVAGASASAKICWLVGQAGIILVTKDAKHWKKIPPPVPADFVAVSAKSASAAVVTAADGQRFATRNGGRKWTSGSETQNPAKK